MGRAPTPPPGKFSRQIIDLVNRELEARGADKSGRWLGENSRMSATYARERVAGERPFNTNDVQELADLFGYESPAAFVEAATRRHLSVVPPAHDVDLETIDLEPFAQAATDKEDTGEPHTP